MASYTLVEIVSKEMIKPSSPTPPNLRNLKLSFLDQTTPPFGVPLILFYKKSDHFPQKMLKQSLADVLTQFYPLAGRIHPDNSAIIDCNDEGVLYIEAQANTELINVLDAPDMEELIQYCPPSDPSQIAQRILALQVTVFKCGGTSVGIRISHTVSDAMSMMNFLSAWAANCRDNEDDIIQPIFGFEGLFPAKDLASCGIYPESSIDTEKLATKLLVFGKKTLMKLKEIAVSSPGSQVKDPTRVEVVSSFIWNHFIQASNSKKDKFKRSGLNLENRPVVAIVTVNIRRRMDPALPDSTFGNIWALTMTKPSMESRGESDLVNELRNAIRSINSDHVMNNMIKSQDSNCLDLLMEPNVDVCIFTSWCRFGVYEVDFGWGKPAWACPATIPIKNCVVLMDNAEGEGIEAWVTVLEKDAPNFFSDIGPDGDI